MSKWSSKGFGWSSSKRSSGFGWSTKRSGGSSFFSAPYKPRKNSSTWAYSVPKKKGTYAKHWGFDPERDGVKVFERKKPRFWIW